MCTSNSGRISLNCQLEFQAYCPFPKNPPVNMLKGYAEINIYSPPEVINYEGETI